MTSVTLTGAKKARRKLFVRFSDETELEFASITDAREWAESVDVDPNTARRICMSHLFRRSPTLSDLRSVKGRAFEVDLAADEPVKVRDLV